MTALGDILRAVIVAMVQHQVRGIPDPGDRYYYRAGTPDAPRVLTGYKPGAWPPRVARKF